MADDTFAKGGGATFVTGSGVCQSATEMPKIMKEGMMREKKSGYKEMYFVLKGETKELVAYKKKINDAENTKEKPKLTFSLADCSGIKPVTEKKYPFAFEVTLGKKHATFACDQPDERESWMHHLRRFAILHEKE
mmetsp:Transcript_8920/g.13524  ORF Transcript_8920/g.13524 Transcript_8920/m.13524 type:complete len:135 (-) Transcript_8920:122-526(-)|eukprot:CAMPEP_0201521120 /NCGR_PEP_ID=MMETSP0161_2-20130828/14232_1 /ASSEMBLY_ACC=CAM_ASM_000251 /TAXON_ID=180227 /ORGANISM="Neoparamoeba aestuarina, Strain SoJaBio B1-5/56/2" /LENGTH=134 /DNA_ID=CAMNT_0047919697 /DNA_START=50 /DNA_END=454 /DNA_ORIENTATION=+